jgi:uncharacterized protein YukE
VHPGQQGTDLTAKVNGHLDYLSQLATRLGVHDPVETYLVPVLGKWNDLHDEATKWRTAAKTAADITSRLTAPLAGLDAAWQGADANSFLDYMQNIGLAGHDLSDALTAMADALDKTATGLHQIASELTDLLAETAEHTSDAMAVPIAGESRARQYLDELDHPSRQLYESVQDILNAFQKLCQGVHGGQMFSQITMSHKMPTQNWTPAPQPPTTRTPPPPTSTRVSVPPPGAPPTTATPAAATPAAATPAAASLGAATPATTPATAAPGTAASTAAAHLTAANMAGAHSAAAGGSPATHAAGGSIGGGAPPAGLTAQSGPPPTSGAVAEPASDTTPQIPGTAQPATANPSTPAGGAGGMPMGGMGGMRGGQGGDAEHKSKIKIAGDPREIFGKPDRTAPPTIGEE